eukprot:TRINITY_DN2776_c0_g1_i1.p1 TRINITY_DN2776_c0_g1~~TRINITY_DN2776_c0_g1_i1.p1  ORF type:complete len:315 (-),score=65.73 TRINITY_DN2776_c0_g1_i1:17-961(-)
MSLPVVVSLPALASQQQEEEQQEEEESSSTEYVVKKVLRERRVAGMIEYEVMWEGGEKTWEPRENLTDGDTVNAALSLFIKRRARKKAAASHLPISTPTSSTTKSSPSRSSAKPRPLQSPPPPTTLADALPLKRDRNVVAASADQQPPLKRLRDHGPRMTAARLRQLEKAQEKVLREALKIKSASQLTWFRTKDGDSFWHYIMSHSRKLLDTVHRRPPAHTFTIAHSILKTGVQFDFWATENSVWQLEGFFLRALQPFGQLWARLLAYDDEALLITAQFRLDTLQLLAAFQKLLSDAATVFDEVEEDELDFRWV